MRGKWRTGLIIAGISLAIMVGLLSLGSYGLTPRMAVWPRYSRLNSARLLERLHVGNNQVYVFQTKYGPQTALVTRHGALWHLSGQWSTMNGNAPIKTLGIADFSQDGRIEEVLTIKTTDASIAYIEAGPAKQRTVQRVIPNQLETIKWVDNGISPPPVAISKHGKVLYFYGYPKGTTNSYDSTEVYWHRVG